MAKKTRKQRYSKKPKSHKMIAFERIEQLFQQARQVHSKAPELSNRYVTVARKIAMKYKLSMPSKYKRQFCKHCYKYLVPGKNVRIRLRKQLVYYCLECKKFTRYRYKK